MRHSCAQRRPRIRRTYADLAARQLDCLYAAEANGIAFDRLELDAWIAANREAAVAALEAWYGRE